MRTPAPNAVPARRREAAAQAASWLVALLLALAWLLATPMELGAAPARSPRRSPPRVVPPARDASCLPTAALLRPVLAERPAPQPPIRWKITAFAWIGSTDPEEDRLFRGRRGEADAAAASAPVSETQRTAPAAVAGVAP